MLVQSGLVGSTENSCQLFHRPKDKKPLNPGTRQQTSKYLTAPNDTRYPSRQFQKFNFFLKIFFFDVDRFQSLLSLLQFCFCFMFQFFGHRHVGSLLPGQGLNPHPLHQKALDCQESPRKFTFKALTTVLASFSKVILVLLGSVQRENRR